MESVKMCSVCGGVFSNLSNLRKHTRNVHFDKFESIFGSKLKTQSVAVSEIESDNKLVCGECKKRFSTYAFLRIHVKKFHEGKVDILAPKENYQCKKCDKQFYHLALFKRHQKEHEDSLPQKIQMKSNFKCPLCSHKDTSNKVILHHFENVHNITIESDHVEFPSFDQFLSWKNKTEKDTKSIFKTWYRKKRECNVYAKYICHRSGNYYPKGRGMRHIKSQGSNKINGYCPASLSVVSKNGKHTVQYIKTHIGHDTDLGHITLTATEKKDIATKIAAKIPFPAILDEVRDSLTNCNLERMHLLTKKDLYNIEQQFKLDAVKHSNDVLSVEAWIKEMSSDVLFYKAQNSFDQQYSSLKNEDFVLIIMTDGQRDMLRKYGEDCICIDGTHGVNSYEFELTTLLILNQIREGFPCAFMISNRADEDVYCIFFSRIMEAMGFKIKPKVFMSDMAEGFYNAWMRVMLPPEFRLFCAWHVDKAWRRNLNKINGKDKQDAVYKNLRALLQETDVSAFHLLAASFITTLIKDNDTKQFALYFQTHYISRVENWAYCYRLHSGLNTNMHIERMHRTIKYLYLKGKCVKRLDKAIMAIMKFVRDKLYDAIIIEYKGKLCGKIKNLRERHKSSQQLDENLIIYNQTKLSWEVPSSSANEIYNIEEKQLHCECKLRCNECAACIHQFTCTCLDSAVKWNMCKHIHLVCMYKKTHSTDNENNLNLNRENSDETNNSHSGVNEKIIKALSKTKNENETLNAAKDAYLASLTNQVKMITSFDELNAMKQITAPVEPTLNAINCRIGQVPLHPTNARMPHNKKIQPQRRFLKTKKKAKKTKSANTPTLEEANLLALKLLHNGDDQCLL